MNAGTVKPRSRLLIRLGGCFELAPPELRTNPLSVLPIKTQTSPKTDQGLSKLKH
jgi:hypothetical protein